MRYAQIVTAIVTVISTACGDGSGPSISAFPQSPADAQFKTSDIENFWAAYDAGGKLGSASAFQTQYLDKASAGLRDFIQARSVTAQSLVQMVQAFPRYFASIRANMLTLTSSAGVINEIRANYHQIEALYPAAVYAPVTFLVGRFSTAGTIRESGMLIGTEFYAVEDTTPLDELGAFQRANVHHLDSIPMVVGHEHTHILQSAAGKLWRKSNKTLLDQALLEGSADFVGELVSGSHINAHVYEYGFAHEAELWTEFSSAMNSTNVSQWLYNQGSATGARPGDLGYFIGYRIAQAYYNSKTDKTAALREIIEVADAAAFLAASGYHGTP